MENGAINDLCITQGRVRL